MAQLGVEDRLLAADFIRQGIRCNAIAPGFIDGEWLKEGFGDAYEKIRDGMIERTPLKRVATPESVADGILSILTGPDLMTGHVVPHEGGALINL